MEISKIRSIIYTLKYYCNKISLEIIYPILWYMVLKHWFFYKKLSVKFCKQCHFWIHVFFSSSKMVIYYWWEKKCQKFMLNFGSINYLFVHLWWPCLYSYNIWICSITSHSQCQISLGQINLTPTRSRCKLWSMISCNGYRVTQNFYQPKKMDFCKKIGFWHSAWYLIWF